MMRSLLLFAALGYFLAALHTAEHHHIADAFRKHDASAPSDYASSHDCPIFTAHSLAVATLPPPEFTAPQLLLKDAAPLPCRAEAYRGALPLQLTARAPPIV